MKRLIFRLSSLGDIILSQALLEAPYEGETHWVVAKEYESLLLGNPKITRVWSYDRKSRPGIAPWLAFLKELRREKFTEVLDVHSTLRTRVAWIYFRSHALHEGTTLRWRGISKERLRRVAYILLKRYLPEAYRPRHLSFRTGLLAGGRGSERPDLKWILRTSKLTGATPGTPCIAIIPSSAWRGKEWPTENYVAMVQALKAEFPLWTLALVGTPNDPAAARLARAMDQGGFKFLNWIGNRSLPEVASLLSECALAVGADTGVLHLAEAVGTPVVTIFGPTRSDFGFGPLHRHSTPVDPTLWCSPCSKDGSLCFRVTEKYRCLKELDASKVVYALRETLMNIEGAK